jgi:cell division protein FtsW
VARKPVSRNRKTLAESGVLLQELAGRIFRAQSIYFYQLLGITLFLVAFGLVMVLSASSIDSLRASNNSFAIFGKQVGFAAIGLIGLSLASLMSMSWWQGRAKLAYLATLGLQLAVLFVGTEINGNRNWISIFGISLQPSEFLKVGVVLHVSVFLAAKVREHELSATWVRALGMMALAMGLVMVGRDLGTVVIMFFMFVGLLTMAGLPMKLLRAIVVITALATPVLVTWGSGSRVGRIMAWLNPSAPDPNGYNWQSEHGMWAVSAGGIFGAGLGESKMKWSWIPEVENDFIFAVIAEELGLVGALVVIALFVALAFAFFRIWQRTSDDFSRYVVSGVMIWITMQALINIAVVLRLLPVLGVPLPLISAGGSSLIATLGAIGIVLAVERENHANPLAGRQGRMPQTRQLRRVR